METLEAEDLEDRGACVGDVGERVPCVREVLDYHEDCVPDTMLSDEMRKMK